MQDHLGSSSSHRSCPPCGALKFLSHKKKTNNIEEEEEEQEEEGEEEEA
jgi:hypothetical protein